MLAKHIVVRCRKEQVKDASRVDTDGHLEPAEEDRLYDHYGLGGTQTYTDTTAGGDADFAGTGTAVDWRPRTAA